MVVVCTRKIFPWNEFSEKGKGEIGESYRKKAGKRRRMKLGYAELFPLLPQFSIEIKFRMHNKMVSEGI